MHFLAAQFAARSIEDHDDILYEANRRTSYFGYGQYSRIDKMRFLPFGYYLFLDIINRKDERDKHQVFDYKLYQLGANVVFEGKDLWDELRPYTTEYLNYYRKRIINGKPENEAYEKPELVDAVNIVDYTTQNIVRNKKYDRRAMLREIHQDLMACVGIVINNIAEDSEWCLIHGVESVKKWDDRFCKDAMEFLISKLESTDISKWRYKPDLIGRLYSNIGACILATARLNKDKILLAQAMEYHKIAKRYREEVTYRHPEVRDEISLIRSNITIGTDYFYYGLWEEDIKKTISYFNDAINLYHNEALRLQGVDPLADYTNDTKNPIERNSDHEEEPQIGAEAYVIWLLIAGCNYMCYERIKGENAGINKEHYLNEQYRSLSAAYIFLAEDCIDENNAGKFNKTKLELNSHEIDKLWGDVSEKYINSFADFGNDNINNCHELMRRIMHLYTSLHEQSGIEDVIYENGIFSIRRS